METCTKICIFKLPSLSADVWISEHTVLCKHLANMTGSRAFWHPFPHLFPDGTSHSSYKTWFKCHFLLCPPRRSGQRVAPPLHSHHPFCVPESHAFALRPAVSPRGQKLVLGGRKFFFFFPLLVLYVFIKKS